MVGAHAARAVGRQRAHVRAVAALALDAPLRRGGGIPHGHLFADPVGRVEQVEHELTHVVGGDPRRSEAHAYLGRPQIGRLGAAQRLDIGNVRGVGRGRQLGDAQLRPHVAGEVFVGGLPDGLLSGRRGNAEYGAFQRFGQFVFPHSGQPRHVGQIDPSAFRQRGSQRRLGVVGVRHGRVGPYRALGEHVRLALEVPLAVEDLQCAQQRVGGILLERGGVRARVQDAVLRRVGVVERVEPCALSLHLRIGRAVLFERYEPSGAIP